MNANDLNRFAYGLTLVLAIAMVVAFVRAVAAGSGPLPPDWLVSWTDWLLSALGVVFAPIALVTTVQAFRRFTGLTPP